MTFILVCFAWIFFRAPNLGTSLRIISGLFTGWKNDQMIIALQSMNGILNHQGLTLLDAGFLLFLIPAVVYIEYKFYFGTCGKSFINLPQPLRWGTYYFLVLIICYFGKSETNTFIYFHF